MLNNEYKFNIDLDLAQFIIAIVLDSYGNKSAAMKVKNFCNVNIHDTDEKINRTKKERDNLYLKILYRTKKMKKSFLETFINMLYYDKCLSGDRGRTNTFAGKLSLLDIGINLSEKELYQKAMLSLLSSEKILIQYMRTSMFFDQFKIWLKHNFGYDPFGNKNHLTDADCRSLLPHIINRVNDYFIDNFDGSVSTPDNYIFQALNKYFKETGKPSGEFNEKSDVSKFYANLNSRGQDREINLGDDSSSTGLSTIGIDLEEEHENIDFRDIAIKICKTSKILYNYKSSNIAFYDIFSRYRDITFISTEKQDTAKKLLIGCSVSKYSAEDSFTLDFADIGPLKDRCAKREVYLLPFTDILNSDGISLKEIKNIYDQQIRITKELPKRDKRRLYSVDRSELKGNFTTNAERFKDIYDGFIALRDFIKFIFSPANTFGITINNFNTEIFRDMKIAETVHDLKSYLTYGDITKKLISEVSTSYDGVNIASNDEINEYVEDAKRRNMFSLLKNTQISNIGAINFSSDELNSQTNTKTRNGLNDNQMLVLIDSFFDKIMKFSIKFPFFKDGSKSPSSFVKDTILTGNCSSEQREYFENCILKMIALYKTTNGQLNFHDSKHFKIISMYLTAIECLMALDGVPMLNNYGFFDYEDLNICVDYLEKVQSNYVTSFSNQSTWYWDSATRIILIDAIFDTFFNDILSSKINNIDKSTIEYWHKYSILFSLNNFFMLYFDDLAIIARYLKVYKSDKLQSYLKLCDYADLLNINSSNVTLDALYSFYDDDLLSYKTGDNIDLLTAKRYRELFNLILNNFYIIVFSEKDNIVYGKLFANIRNEIYNEFKPNGSIQVVNTNSNIRNLQEISDFLYRTYQTHSKDDKLFCNDQNLLNRFKTLADFDRYGFAMCKDNVYVTRDGYALHELGTAVKIQYVELVIPKAITSFELATYDTAIHL